MASYRVSRLYDSEGNVAEHFVGEEFHQFCDSWETAMAIPQFAAVIERELEAELVADAPLSHLAAYAPSERARKLYAKWLTYIDDELEPWTTGGAIHFRPHWARVMIHALTIAESMGLCDGDLNALAMAAVFHDSRRKSPYLDTGHGGRASRYYTEACEACATDAVAGASGLFEACRAEATPGMPTACETHETRAPLAFDERCALAIAWHDRDDEDGLRAAEKLERSLGQRSDADPQTILRIFKDADGLDRVRLGEGGLDARYLRTDAARSQIAFAHELLRAV